MRRCSIRSSLPAVTRALVILTALVLVPALAGAQANGKLQIHHIRVGQGDGTLLISPLGQTALFDDGVYTNCTEIKSYLQARGISVVDYHFTSHYHADHIGCIDDLAAVGITVGTKGYDRGSSYSSATFDSYVATLGAKRATIAKGQTITLDAGAANPVFLTCVDLNGAGVYSPSGSDENAKSVVMKVTYGAFDEVIAGDLTGSTTQGNDVETTVGPEVGDVEVYKVHHHGSRYSSNDNWLNATTPEVGIIQCGNGNTYGHPTAEALGRLHAHSVKTYWNETGAGATPDPLWDRVANGAIVIEADPGANANYTVSGSGFSDTYTNGGGAPPPPPIHATEVAEAIALLKGSITVGDYTRLAANDAVRVSISAGIETGKYVTDWYGSALLDHPPINLSITYDGNYTVSRTQTLSLWNWTTSAWDQINSSTVSTSDVTKTWSTTSPAAYVSATREVRLRVRTNTRNGSFTCRGDYLAFDYDYASGTAPSLLATESPRSAPEVERPLASLRGLEATSSGGRVSLVWAVDAGADVDGFNVYRMAPDGSLVFAGHEADLEWAGGEARFRFAEEGRDATYWLGVRGCSGPEVMMGPIRVQAGPMTPAIALAAFPNPIHDRTQFVFDTDREEEILLTLFDVSGRRLVDLFRGKIPAGHHQIAWDSRAASGERVRSGVYFARLQGPASARFARVIVVDE